MLKSGKTHHFCSVLGSSPSHPKEGLEDALNPGFALPAAVSDADACGAPAHVRSTSLPNATLNLVLAVLGAGQLTLPYAMGQPPGEMGYHGLI